MTLIRSIIFSLSFQKFLEPNGLTYTFKHILMKNASSNKRYFSTKPNDVKKAAKNSVDENELLQIEKLTASYWDENGVMKMLHSMNNFRIEFICGGLIGAAKPGDKTSECQKPLEGCRILDAGCGAGIMSEPLAKLGAKVTGVDVNKEMINVAMCHIKQSPDIEQQVVYKHESVEDHAKEHPCCYDAVIATEVLQRITEKEMFVEACIQCLKGCGSLFVTTLNKTLSTRIFYIFPSEYLFKTLPIGTHTLDKCITPEELCTMLGKYRCHAEEVQGMSYKFLKNEWCWTCNTNKNYAVHGKKLKAA